MSLPLVKPGGFGVSEPLASADLTSLDQQLQHATDDRYNPDYLPTLNIQRWTDTLQSATDYHDIVWDPVSREFLLIADDGAGNTLGRLDSEWFGDYGPGNQIHAGGLFTKGGDYSDHLVVLSDVTSGGAILRGDFANGWALAATPPGVQIGRPIYAWDIDTWVVTGSDVAYYSVDDAVNWTVASTPPAAASHVKRLTPATNGTRILVGDAAASTTSYAWSDDGDEWTDGVLPNAVEEVQLAWDPSSGIWVAAGKTPGANTWRTFASEDNGETFALISETAVASPRVMAIGFVNKLLVVGTQGGRLLASADFGATWVDIGLNMAKRIGNTAERTRILCGPFSPNMVISFVSNEEGVSSFRRSIFASMRNRLY